MSAYHTCNVCHLTAPWNSNWAYYGSIADVDEHVPVFKTCSAKCRAKVPDPDKALDQLRMSVLGYAIRRRGCVIKKVRV